MSSDSRYLFWNILQKKDWLENESGVKILSIICKNCLKFSKKFSLSLSAISASQNNAGGLYHATKLQQNVTKISSLFFDKSQKNKKIDQKMTQVLKFYKYLCKIWP